MKKKVDIINVDCFEDGYNRNEKVVVFYGETGSGKTTELLKKVLKSLENKSNYYFVVAYHINMKAIDLFFFLIENLFSNCKCFAAKIYLFYSHYNNIDISFLVGKDFYESVFSIFYNKENICKNNTDGCMCKNMLNIQFKCIKTFFTINTLSSSKIIITNHWFLLKPQNELYFSKNGVKRDLYMDECDIFLNKIKDFSIGHFIFNHSCSMFSLSTYVKYSKSLYMLDMDEDCSRKIREDKRILEKKLVDYIENTDLILKDLLKDKIKSSNFLVKEKYSEYTDLTVSYYYIASRSIKHSMNKYYENVILFGSLTNKLKFYPYPSMYSYDKYMSADIFDGDVVLSNDVLFYSYPKIFVSTSLSSWYACIPLNIDYFLEILNTCVSMEVRNSIVYSFKDYRSIYNNQNIFLENYYSLFNKIDKNTIYDDIVFFIDIVHNMALNHSFLYGYKKYSNNKVPAPYSGIINNINYFCNFFIKILVSNISWISFTPLNIVMKDFMINILSENVNDVEVSFILSKRISNYSFYLDLEDVSKFIYLCASIVLRFSDIDFYSMANKYENTNFKMLSNNVDFIDSFCNYIFDIRKLVKDILSGNGLYIGRYIDTISMSSINCFNKCYLFTATVTNSFNDIINSISYSNYCIIQVKNKYLHGFNSIKSIYIALCHEYSISDILYTLDLIRISQSYNNKILCFAPTYENAFKISSFINTNIKANLSRVINSKSHDNDGLINENLIISSVLGGMNRGFNAKLSRILIIEPDYVKPLENINPLSYEYINGRYVWIMSYISLRINLNDEKKTALIQCFGRILRVNNLETVNAKVIIITKIVLNISDVLKYFYSTMSKFIKIKFLDLRSLDLLKINHIMNKLYNIVYNGEYIENSVNYLNTYSINSRSLLGIKKIKNNKKIFSKSDERFLYEKRKDLNNVFNSDTSFDHDYKIVNCFRKREKVIDFNVFFPEIYLFLDNIFIIFISNIKSYI